MTRRAWKWGFQGHTYLVPHFPGSPPPPPDLSTSQQSKKRIWCLSVWLNSNNVHINCHKLSLLSPQQNNNTKLCIHMKSSQIGFFLFVCLFVCFFFWGFYFLGLFFKKKQKTKTKTFPTPNHRLKVLAKIPYFNFHFFPHLLIFLQFRDPSYVLNLSTKGGLQKCHI